MRKVYVFLFCIVSTFNVFSQKNDSTYHEITLNNGMILNGFMIKQKNDTLIFRGLDSNVFTISRNDIKDLQTKKYILNSEINTIQNTRDESKKIKIILKDESIITGTLVNQTSDSITISPDFTKKLTIPINQIKNIEYSNYRSFKELSKIDPNRTNEFFTQTGLTEKTGTLYIGSYEVFGIGAGTGITDWLTINAGFLIYSPDESRPLLNLGVKVGTSEFKNNIAFSAGAQFLVSPDRYGSTLSEFYGSFSYGNLDSKFNICTGTLSTAGSELKSSFFLAFGFDRRIGNSSKILGELWIIPDNDFLPLFLGFRFFGTNLVGDLGVLIPLAEKNDGVTFFPVLKFVYHF